MIRYYLETHSIRDDFGMELHDNLYPADDWNADINFFVDCLQFYLTTIGQSIKINPPMKNVQQRTLMAVMGQPFHDWALVYFSPEGGNINKMLVKEEAMKDFVNASNAKNWATQRFTRSLKSFCRKYDYTLNPKAYQNGQGRIIRKNDSGKSAEMIYVQTAEEIDITELSKQSYNGQSTSLPF